MIYTTIVADPPWPFKDRLPGKGRGAAKHYDVMTMDEIKGYPIGVYSADDSRLFLWSVAAMAEEGYATLRAWGYRPVGELIWQKLTKTGKPWFGMGRTVRATHERCLIGVRGRPELLSRSVRSLFSARVGRHSEKPDEFFEIVEQLSPGPYLELFGRRLREGWTVVGDQVFE